MNKNQWLKTVNSVMFVSLLLQVFTSLWLLLHFTRTALTIHKYNGLFFIILVITHIILNWPWIRSALFKR
ncbi:MAG: hypothetical protein AUJ74_07350 [Candidatus Omnitrophica bacterium CG1_02_44_16]|nr:MAG: hypothetical protein AUJ74_07350 [Candidatus Omnitrophica bacterium CG1_02_44_16]PIY82308.1 MAG: hypothetical protein COY78_07680 [Candidatus Omnitrophica bacterium CG_4_10_14_0_8_um_filter_44_12]PIZ84602.1 MAG: hypothetical protein COX96_03115 [Candidatus Omnitrophica bacterium CG_4_10_14_0_2_um_filter_44_9]